MRAKNRKLISICLVLEPNIHEILCIVLFFRVCVVCVRFGNDFLNSELILVVNNHVPVIAPSDLLQKLETVDIFLRLSKQDLPKYSQGKGTNYDEGYIQIKD